MPKLIFYSMMFIMFLSFFQMISSTNIFTMILWLMMFSFISSLIVSNYLGVWFFFMVSLVFLGGMMILFFFCLSLSTSFKTKKNKFMSTILMVLIIFWLLQKFVILSPMKLFISSNFFFFANSSLLGPLSVYLFLCLLTVSKITESYFGAALKEI